MANSYYQPSWVHLERGIHTGIGLLPQPFIQVHYTLSRGFSEVIGIINWTNQLSQWINLWFTNRLASLLQGYSCRIRSHNTHHSLVSIRSHQMFWRLSQYIFFLCSAKALTRTSSEGENKIAIFKLLIKPNAIKGRELTSFEGKCEMKRVSQVLKACSKRSFPKVSRHDVIQRVQHLTFNWEINSEKSWLFFSIYSTRFLAP